PDGDRALLGRGLLERLELALKQALRHEVAPPSGEAASDQLAVAPQIDQTHPRPLADDDIAIAALQGGAADDAAPPFRLPPVDLAGDRAKPGHAVVVVERHAGAHLGDVLRRVEVV